MFSRVSLLMEFVHALYRITRFLNGRSSTASRFRIIASAIRVIRSRSLAFSESVYAMAVLTVIHLIVYPVQKLALRGIRLDGKKVQSKFASQQMSILHS